MIVVGKEEETVRKVFEKAKSGLMIAGDPYLVYPLLERYVKGL
jgi:CO dehydrogenase/acetyl-CoA synthase epsilon subunit